ncbi:unnamed protein product [Sphenostylis stenocarpa]|uniref:Uncharacterized protein n=1 Tax=Sphenostylis stenocarpa TaxID=92480 RepID=A0AA86T3C8_9FABA|nr:unnamed protein product [Sphenostylis stenocarpa]
MIMVARCHNGVSKKRFQRRGLVREKGSEAFRGKKSEFRESGETRGFEYALFSPFTYALLHVFLLSGALYPEENDLIER